MNGWTTRLRDRIAQQGLTKAAVIRHVRIDHKTLTRFLAGALEHGLHPDQFQRLCEVLAVTPNQALGLEPMDGADPVSPDPLAPVVERLLGRAGGLTPENLALVADLLDQLAHHRVGLGRRLPADAEA